MVAFQILLFSLVWLLDGVPRRKKSKISKQKSKFILSSTPFGKVNERNYIKLLVLHMSLPHGKIKDYILVGLWRDGKRSRARRSGLNVMVGKSAPLPRFPSQFPQPNQLLFQMLSTQLMLELRTHGRNWHIIL